MTAEIAILNRSAVTLAADSAVTIGRGSGAKIYNTVNKIFELHETEPVGIMVYGQLNFMGLPIETLVKQYRKERSGKRFDTIVDYKKDFVSWLETEVVVNDKHDLQNAYLIVSDLLQAINKKVKDEIYASINKTGKYLKGKENGIAQKVIKEEMVQLVKCAKLPHFGNGYKKALEPFYRQAIDLAIDKTTHDYTPKKATKQLLVKLSVEKLARKSLSSYRTGFVIAGFGKKEICPSLEAFEADGILRSKLKYEELPGVDIDRLGSSADVIGFAQDDMIQSFLNGADPSLVGYFKAILSEVTEKLATAIFDVLVLGGAPMPQAARDVINQMKADYNNKIEKYQEREFTKRVKDLIGVMPKQEVANLAKALIELTSLKRRVTRDQESVGGEVDVAVISKSEGFVWVKRKHYFSADLNPRFFANHYREIKP